ncbi:MAG: protoporphyrinogen oxidase [Anaerolineales bacterium]
MPHIIVVGGGITGLSAAWELQQRGISYSLLEAASHWGGKIISVELDVDGKSALADGGPDTLVTRKPEAWELAAELGILDQIENPGSETKNIYVLDGGIPVEIPLSPFKFITSPLLSGRGKLRLLLEPFQPPRRDSGDESLAEFVARRLGREALDKFIGPVLGGIYNTDPETQSILVSSPIMREMEAESGGLFVAALQRAFRKPESTSKNKPEARFISFKGGVAGLVEALKEKLTGDLRLNTPVKKIESHGAGYKVTLQSGESLHGDGVIVCTLASVAGELVQSVAPEAGQKLREIGHKNIGTVSLVYRETDIPAEPVINGLMIPRREKRAIDAITVSSRKMPWRVPEGFALLRIFIGGARPEVVNMPDKALLETVSDELRALLGIKAAPQTHAIFRWPGGFPQAEVGHLERIDQIETLLPPGIALAGSSYRGIAVPDCIRQGRAAAEKILAQEIL